MVAIIQLAAAQLAGLDSLVYHTFASQFTRQVMNGQDLLHRYLSSSSGLLPMNSSKSVENFLDWSVSLGLEWGTSDGN
jgi:hypothetical protein